MRGEGREEEEEEARRDWNSFIHHKVALRFLPPLWFRMIWEDLVWGLKPFETKLYKLSMIVTDSYILP